MLYLGREADKNRSIGDGTLLCAYNDDEQKGNKDMRKDQLLHP
jgi:hypothetical protein